MKEPTSKNIIGREVARLRNERALSQADLAALAQRSGWDISRETIAKIESGVRWVADVEVVKWAQIFKVPLSELFPAKERK